MYTESECIEAIERVAGSNETLKRGQYEDKRKDNDPCSDTIVSKFDGWKYAIEQTTLSGPLPVTKSRAIESLKSASSKVDGTLTPTKYGKYRSENSPTFNQILSVFDSWSEAKREAGLKTQKKGFTKSECYNALREVGNMVESPPSRIKYDEIRKNEHPSSQTIHKVCESWGEAKKTVFETDDASLKSQENISRMECINALKKVVDLKDVDLMTISKYEELRTEDMPSSETIRRKFGGWTNALSAAEIQTKTKQRRHSRADCIKAMRKTANAISGPLTQEKYQENAHPSYPSKSTIINKFGSWNSAKEVAGIALTQLEFTDTECIAALRSVARKLDSENLSVNEYEVARNDSHPSVSTIRKKLGSWNTAIEKAGLNPNKSRNPHYSISEFINAINEISVEGKITKQMYENNREQSHPSIDEIEENFKSFRSAVRISDVEYSTPKINS